MSEEKKTSIKAEVFSWVKVIVSAIIIALLVDFFIIANAEMCIRDRFWQDAGSGML